MYTVDDYNLQKETLFEQVKSVLDDYDVYYKDYYIREFLDTWYNAKAPLLELLSKHESFVPEELAIVFDADYIRKANINDAMRQLREMCDQMYWGLPPEKRNDIDDEDFMWRDELTTISYKLQDFIIARIAETGKPFSGMVDEIVLAYMKTFGLYDGNASSAKLSRVLRKYIWQKAPLFEEYGLSRTMEQMFAVMADMLNNAKITRHTALSLHPCDYLLMSNGASGWRSCHMIPDGEWSAGTISYACDSTSLVFYTVDKGYDNTELKIFRQPKIHRQMYFYDRGRLFQARLYPSNCQDDEAINNYRHTVQQIFADCLSIPNLWTLKHYDTARKYIKPAAGACQYHDYHNEYDGRQTLSISQCMETPDEDDPIIAGAKTYDFYGNLLYYNNTINSGEDTYWCEACQEYHNGEPYGYVHGDPFCEDAYDYGSVVSCDWCGGYEWADSCTEVYGRNGCTLIVCDNCCGDFTECCICGEYHHNDNIFLDIHGNAYCYDHWEEEVTHCEHCGEAFPNDEVQEVNGHWYCDGCADEIREEAE